MTLETEITQEALRVAKEIRTVEEKQDVVFHRAWRELIRIVIEGNA